MGGKAVNSESLPEGWREVQLGEVCLIDQETLSSETPDDYCFQYISLSDVEKGNLIQTRKYKFSEAPSRARRIVKQGDVLLATVRSYLQGFYILKDEVEDCIASTGFAVLTAKRHLLDPAYLFQMLFSNRMLAIYHAANVGSNYPAINSSDIPKFKVCLPPLPEQKAIASLLATWDTAIEKTEALIEAKEKRFKWLLKRLTKPNKHWKKSVMGNAFELGRGRVISKKYLEENKGIYPVFSSQTSNNGEFGRINTFDFEGDYLTWTTDGANAGEVFFRTGKFNCTNVCGTAKPKDEKEVYACFIAYYLKGKTHKYVSYVGNPKLMNGVFGTIPIHYPSLSQQQTIANVLSTTQREIILLEKLTERYGTQKRGLMQKLLTGQWRAKR